jgi:hypothetical protein
VHDNPPIFPDPYHFRPERWLENPDLDQWLASFSRGPRMCLGMKYDVLLYRCLQWLNTVEQFGVGGAAFDLLACIP